MLTKSVPRFKVKEIHKGSHPEMAEGEGIRKPKRKGAGTKVDFRAGKEGGQGRADCRVPRGGVPVSPSCLCFVVPGRQFNLLQGKSALPGKCGPVGDAPTILFLFIYLIL